MYDNIIHNNIIKRYRIVLWIGNSFTPLHDEHNIVSFGIEFF